MSLIWTDMQAKAKDLLQQANEQLRTAANYANRNHK